MNLLITDANNSQYTDQFDHIQSSTYTKPCSQFWRNFKPQLQLQIIPKKADQYHHFQAQHIISPVAKKRSFWRNFEQTLQLQIIPRRSTNMITIKAKKKLNHAAKNGHFGEISSLNYSCK